MEDERFLSMLSDIHDTLIRIAVAIEKINNCENGMNFAGSDRSDQIRSNHQSSSDRSDQIDEPIMKNHSSSKSVDLSIEGDMKLMDDFRALCADYGIPFLHKDLGSAIRNIRYFMKKKDIVNRKTYIEKMMDSIPNITTVGFHASNHIQIPEEEHNDLIMGIDPAVVVKNMKYMDEKTYNETIKFIPQHGSMFSSWERCKSNDLKLRILTAYAINNNIITPESDDQ